jgi:hypothetical protein
MKPLLTRIVIISLLILSLPGCKKNLSVSHKQSILFQFDYLNYAWGYQHNGFYIDNNGNVLKYNNPENWNFPDKDKILTKNQVEENISKCVQADIKISNDELQKLIKYIDHIASSKVTAIKNVAADAGASEYICYQYSENTGYYKGSLIKLEGDFTCENLNFFSKKVYTWMKEIGNSISGN